MNKIASVVVMILQCLTLVLILRMGEMRRRVSWIRGTVWSSERYVCCKNFQTLRSIHQIAL